MPPIVYAGRFRVRLAGRPPRPTVHFERCGRGLNLHSYTSVEWLTREELDRLIDGKPFRVCSGCLWDSDLMAASQTR